MPRQLSRGLSFDTLRTLYTCDENEGKHRENARQGEEREGRGALGGGSFGVFLLVV